MSRGRRTIEIPTNLPPELSELTQTLEAMRHEIDRLNTANLDMSRNQLMNVGDPVRHRDVLILKTEAGRRREALVAQRLRPPGAPSPIVVPAPVLTIKSIDGGLEISITHPDLAPTAITRAKGDPLISGIVLYHRKGASIAMIGDEDGQIDIPANLAGTAGNIVYNFMVADPNDLSFLFFFRATATRSDGKVSVLSDEVSGRALTTLPPTTAEKPDPPNLTVRADGGNVFTGYGFGIGAAFSSDTGRGGTVKTQLQVARKKDSVWSNTTGFTAEKVYDEEHDPPPTFFKILLDESNTFRFTARIFNGLANGGAGVWSNWSAPLEATATDTRPDSGVPGPVNAFLLSDPLQAIGNSVLANWTPPLSNSNIVWAYELQLKLANWNADQEDMLGLENITFTGSGTLEHGGGVLTDLGASFPTPNGLAGDILYLYTALNTTTGVLTDPFAYLIASNTATAITIVTAADGAKFRPSVSLTPVYAVADDWKGIAQGWIYNQILIPSDAAVPGIPVFVGRVLIGGITSPVFGRIRALNGFGRAQWKYHSDTTDRGAAVAFAPSKAQASAVSAQVITSKLLQVALDFVGSDQWETSDGSKIDTAYVVYAHDAATYTAPRLFTVVASPNNNKITFTTAGSALIAGAVSGEPVLLYVKEEP